MKKFVDANIEKIIYIFLILQPIIDCLTAFSINYLKFDVTFGVIIRILFLLLLTCYNFFNKNTSRKSKIYLIILGLYFTLFIGNIILLKDFSSVFYEFKNLIRCFYFPILLLNLYEISETKKIEFTTSLIRNIYYIYIILIIVPIITKTDFTGYFEGKVGSIGWFQSTNEISAILSGLLPFLLIKNKYKIFDIIGIILTVIVLFSLGSKVTIVFLGVTLIFAIINYFKNFKNKKKIIMMFSPIIVLSVISLFIFVPKTNFYKNIEIHLNFLGVSNVLDIFKSEELIDHFIFSSRLTFLSNTRTSYMESTLSEKFLGIGFIERYATDDVSLKTIEMDIFDIFYRSGIIGSILYLAPVYLVLSSRRYKRISKTKLSIGIFMLISILAGHVLTSPAVSIYLAILILDFIKEDCLCKQE